MKRLAKFLSWISVMTVAVWSLAAAAEKDSRDRHPLDNQGGADEFGYVFVDNQTGDTATFEWIELDSDPEAVPLFDTCYDDRCSPFVPLVDGFPFYGVVHDSFCVSTNGNIQFITQSTSYFDF
jgi:hypothetical protein